MADKIQDDQQAPVKTPTREEMERNHAAKAKPTPEALADALQALMDGYQSFRFLAETFGALNATEVTLTLSSDAAAGLSHMCEQAAGKLLDAYGNL